MNKSHKPSPDEIEYDKILDALERIDDATSEFYAARTRRNKTYYLLHERVLPRLSPYYQNQLKQFLAQLPKDHGGMSSEWLVFFRGWAGPTKPAAVRPGLHLVADNPPQPSTQRRRRPSPPTGTGDSPAA
jgi:hypothetical protein